VEIWMVTEGCAGLQEGGNPREEYAFNISAVMPISHRDTCWQWKFRSKNW
jgi:hypothetical protein